MKDDQGVEGGGEMRGKGKEGEECKGQTETSATQQERRTGACLCCVDPAGHPKAGAVRQTGALMSWLPHNPLLLGPLRFVDCVHKHRPPPLVLLHGCALTAPLTVLSWWEARKHGRQHCQCPGPVPQVQVVGGRQPPLEDPPLRAGDTIPAP